jgi:hypothetical protein
MRLKTGKTCIANGYILVKLFMPKYLNQLSPYSVPRREGWTWRYNSTVSLTSALDGGGWSLPRPVRFTTLKDARYLVYRRLGGPRGRPRRVRKFSRPQGLNARTFQSVASCYRVTSSGFLEIKILDNIFAYVPYLFIGMELACGYHFVQRRNLATLQCLSKIKNIRKRSSGKPHVIRETVQCLRKLLERQETE